MVERKMSQVPGAKLSRQQKGQLGEDSACRWLEQHDYRIIQRNWRCRSGEIDIIAAYEDVLVFVEVRSRSATSSFGTPQESVNMRKMQQVRSTASVYMQMTGENDRQIRFDVIAVMLKSTGETISVDHIKSAF